MVTASKELIDDVAALLAGGAVVPRVAARYPLGRVAEAHRRIEESNPGADVVVAVDARSRIRGLEHAAA